jgi:hypothetical protein
MEWSGRAPYLTGEWRWEGTLKEHYCQSAAGIADNLRFHHAKSRQTKLRTYASFTYQAGSWTRPRKVVARLECSLQPDTGETTSTGMRQEVDIRYVVTSLKGSAQHLYENVYCQRGQTENLIKLHKAQLASDRAQDRLRHARPPARAARCQQTRIVEGARQTRNPAAHQRIGERHPLPRHPAQGQCRHPQ